MKNFKKVHEMYAIHNNTDVFARILSSRAVLVMSEISGSIAFICAGADAGLVG
jgi:hypothetical protein